MSPKPLQPKKPFVQTYIPTPEEILLGEPESPPRPNFFDKHITIEWHHSPSMIPAKTRAALMLEKPCNAANWTEIGSLGESSDEEEDFYGVRKVAENWSRFNPLFNKETNEPWKPRCPTRERYIAMGELARKLMNSDNDPLDAFGARRRGESSNQTQNFAEMNLQNQTSSTSGCSSSKGESSKSFRRSDPFEVRRSVANGRSRTPLRSRSGLEDFQTPVKKARMNRTKNGAKLSSKFTNQFKMRDACMMKTSPGFQRECLWALGSPIASSTPTLKKNGSRESVVRSKELISPIKPVPSTLAMASGSIHVGDLVSSASDTVYEDSFDDPRFDAAFIFSPTKSVDAGTNDNVEVTASSSNTCNKNLSRVSTKMPTPPGSLTESNPPITERPANYDSDDSFWSDSPIICLDDSPMPSSPKPTASVPEPTNPIPDPVPKPPTPKSANDPYDSFDEDLNFEC